MADWYYFQGGAQQGPVSDDHLRNMVASGQLNPNDSVWRAGMANWAPISSVPELMPAAPAAPPPQQYGAPPAPAYDQGHGAAPAYGAPSYGEPSYREPSYGRAAAPGAIKPITPWAIILISGAGLWFINGFLPWYSFGDFGGFGGGTWLGFSTGTGLFAFVMSLFILGGVITSFFVPILVPWRWTGAFFFALMALILLIMGMVAAFSGVGKSIGPWIHLIATLAVLTGAVLEGIFGLMAFLATMQKGSSRPM